MNKNFYSKLIPSKTSSKLATAQASNLTNFGKNSFIPCYHSNDGTEGFFN